MTAALHTFAAIGPVSDFARAQLLLDQHISQLEAALRHLDTGKARMLPSIFDGHRARLLNLRKLCLNHQAHIMACPDAATCTLQELGPNARGLNIQLACERATDAVARAGLNAYRDMLAARRGGLAVVRS